MTSFDFQTRAVAVTTAGCTDPGQLRADNQDDFLIADLSVTSDAGVCLRPELEGERTPSAAFHLGSKGALLAVADGMGGAGGSVASRIATTFIHSRLVAAWGSETSETPQAFATHLRRAVEDVNHLIHHHGSTNIDVKGMGSTVTAVGVLDGFLYIGQVGDSRAYLVRGGVAVRLTRDQTVVQAMVEAGTLTPEQARDSQYRTALLQALGVGPSISVDVTFQEAQRGDVLVICSDGLYRVVTDEEIARMVTADARVTDVASSLVDLANERGGPDNVTVIVTRLDGEGLGDPDPSRAAGRTVMVLPAD